jgi:hypothetical protein
MQMQIQAEESYGDRIWYIRFQAHGFQFLEMDLVEVERALYVDANEGARFRNNNRSVLEAYCKDLDRSRVGRAALRAMHKRYPEARITTRGNYFKEQFGDLVEHIR